MSYADIANFEFDGRISAQRYEAILTRRETIAADDKAHWGGFCELYAHCQKHNTRADVYELAQTNSAGAEFYRPVFSVGDPNATPITDGVDEFPGDLGKDLTPQQ